MKKLLFAAGLVALCMVLAPVASADACTGMDGCEDTAEATCGRPSWSFNPCAIVIAFGNAGSGTTSCSFRCSCTGPMEYTIWCEGEGGGGERECNPMDCPSMSLNEAFPLPDEQEKDSEVPTVTKPPVEAAVT